ncbi:hypothetical protein [Halostella salina]|uniref:hypothetical protein n=1 Tax=Halostella salina TaxID=1547897 RepID=UPI000EF847CB|nr:hypothetical protein [Halostella salina]
MPPTAVLHAGHGDPIPGLLLGITFGVALAGGFVAALADREAWGQYAVAAVLSFATAYAVAETTPHTNALVDTPAVAAVALAVPALHLAVAAVHDAARPALLAPLYAGPVALVGYLLVNPPGI